jgi:transketolase
LTALGKKNGKIIALDSDTHTYTGLDEFMRTLPGQFIELGIAEQNVMGWAAGIAASGLTAFVTMFGSFATKRALDQIKVCIAYPRLNVKIAGSYTGLDSSRNGATHQCVEDLAIMRAMPNMRVLCPGDINELEQMLDAMVEYEGPVYFRIPRECPPLFPGTLKFNWQPVLIQDGSDLLFVSMGSMSHRCKKVIAELEKNGISAALIHASTLKPFSEELIVQYARKCGAVVTVEDHSIFGGLGGAVCETLSRNWPTPVATVGYMDTFISSCANFSEELFVKYGLSHSHIIKAAQGVLNKKKT